ncbi:hypothetical protein [Ectopseudomonas mendocina]|uniref:DUF2523 domain-containing protein n=1 Tax=Ectopseudomonas mendocina S5.2 TaxID=1225174 RepID=A0ABM5VVA2_ECTME|nr:hypothetical protein [Pseudomonas mendocina]ALN18772.1 hypothetical protein DW68_009050 [Pseudomonas mendocina S5.2]KES00374.1 hypothetical protein HN51_11150 [Pseudomonas mendocina]
MGWLLNFFKKLFPNAFAWLAKFLLGFIMPILGPVLQAAAALLRKVAIFLLILAAIGSAIAVLAAGIDYVVSRLASFAAPDLVIVGRMFLPDNLSFCVSLLVFLKLKSLAFYWVTKLSEKLIHT